MSGGQVPMPNTAHPGLEDYADAVRSSTVDPLFILQAVGMTASYSTDAVVPSAVSPQPTVLTKKKAAGPAPFGGDPVLNDAHYFWWVWIDDMGRHVAGDADLVWRYSDYRDEWRP